MKYKVKVIKKEDIASGTMSFHFEKPAGFEYRAGQSVDVTLIDPPETDTEGNTRAYSLASSPDEVDLMIATRMRDTAFKRVLKNSENLDVEIDGPFGSFTLHQKSDRPAIFLIGGIGITPIYSIIKDATRKGLPHRLCLLYSNRKQEDAAFLSELGSLAEENKNFTFVPTMTDDTDYEGEKGYIDEAMIRRYVPMTDDAIFYLSGPAAMVTTMRKVLEGMYVSDDDIKTEEFSGY